MELLVESVIESKLSTYEIERNKPMPSRNHAKLQSRIAHLILSQYEEFYDVLSEPTLDMLPKPRVPDLAFMKPETADWFSTETKIQDIPVGIVEILSPTQNEIDLAGKFNLYFDYGVKSAWLVVPIFKTIHVFTAARKYKTFTIEDKILKDEILQIELNLEVVFK